MSSERIDTLTTRVSGARPPEAAGADAAAPAAADRAFPISPESLASRPAEDRKRTLDRLSSGAGNHMVSRMLHPSAAVGGAQSQSVARVHMPLSGPAPESGGQPAGVTLDTFLQVIEAEEARNATIANDTKLMITKLRKLFYGTRGWDAHLIPGAASVTPLYGVRETSTRSDLEVPYMPNGMWYLENRTELIDAPEALRHPEQIQEVRMPNGDFVDVGHVLAGLDAHNHPEQDVGMGNISISTNEGAVTWIGDLGSVLAEAKIRAMRRGDVGMTEADYQAEIDRMAPSQDMLGNVDAYVIGRHYAIASRSGDRVSQILRGYYGGANPVRELQRFQTFAGAIGLTGWDGSHFADESAWIEDHVDDVNDAAAMYLYIQTEVRAYNPYGQAQRAGAIAGMAANQGARRLLWWFLGALRVEYAAERSRQLAGVP